MRRHGNTNSSESWQQEPGIRGLLFCAWTAYEPVSNYASQELDSALRTVQG